ncbi:MAG: hypothetical protein NXH95_21460 [Pseudomonadaceae bacterium]|nr:hypothetical protein [Pseudomonadaceae bacterium]
MRTFILLTSTLAALWLTTAGQPAYAQQAKPAPSAEQQLLQRVYQLRMRFEQERMQAENEARANVRLVTGNGGNRNVDAPTVSGLRQQTSAQLSRFESQFQCLDVEVEANSGNTVVICGDNTGDITGSNVSAERDIVTLQGGQR